MPYVKRGNYIKIMDRFNLPYLNTFEKVYCAYCGYANGVMHYWTEIAAKTESYWCGIKHEKTPQFISPQHHENFIEYGDKEEFKQKYLCK